MISGIHLENFKCFRELNLPTGALTLLAGLNGTGKSSVIQSLLLLRQSWQLGLLQKGKLALNGDLAQIGTAEDALYESADDEVIKIGLRVESGEKLDWTFDYGATSDVVSSQSSVVEETTLSTYSTLFSDRFQYLGAERTGPRTFYPTSTHLVENLHQLGPRGEFAANYLNVFGGKQVVLRGVLRDGIGSRLIDQVEAWMELITPGTRLKFVPHGGMDLVQLQYQFASGEDVSKPYRPTNVGFGLTYTLPILVALLSAEPGDLLLLENPEAHLHPRGQARLGQLISGTAAEGVQVVVETHSDHLLNGIRLAVHQGTLAPERAFLHYFGRGDGTAERGHSVTTPHLDRNGRLDQWPPGFFDEWEQALDQLLLPART